VPRNVQPPFSTVPNKCLKHAERSGAQSLKEMKITLFQGFLSTLVNPDGLYQCLSNGTRQCFGDFQNCSAKCASEPSQQIALAQQGSTIFAKCDDAVCHPLPGRLGRCYPSYAQFAQCVGLAEDMCRADPDKTEGFGLVDLSQCLSSEFNFCAVQHLQCNTHTTVCASHSRDVLITLTRFLLTFWLFSSHSSPLPPLPLPARDFPRAFPQQRRARYCMGVMGQCLEDQADMVENCRRTCQQQLGQQQQANEQPQAPDAQQAGTPNNVALQRCQYDCMADRLKTNCSQAVFIPCMQALDSGLPAGSHV